MILELNESNNNLIKRFTLKEPRLTPYTSHIIIHAHNPEGKEIGGIAGFENLVLVYANSILVGHADGTSAIIVTPGHYLIEAKFNGMTKSQEVDLVGTDTEIVLTFTFPRVEVKFDDVINSIGNQSSSGSCSVSDSAPPTPYIDKWAYAYLGLGTSLALHIWGGAPPIEVPPRPPHTVSASASGIVEMTISSSGITSKVTGSGTCADSNSPPNPDPAYTIGINGDVDHWNGSYPVYNGTTAAFYNPDILTWYVQKPAGAPTPPVRRSVLKIDGSEVPGNPNPSLATLPIQAYSDAPCYWITWYGRIIYKDSVGTLFYYTGYKCSSVPYAPEDM